MLIEFKTYPFINSKTGKKPVTGDEFLYLFFIHKEDPDRKVYLCMDPTRVHPIKKHPLGVLGYISVCLIMLEDFLFDLSPYPQLILLCGIITGSMFSLINYIVYYIRLRKWKQKVILDWKSNKLRYKYSESTLSDFNFQLGCSPIDEKLFF